MFQRLPGGHEEAFGEEEDDDGDAAAMATSRLYSDPFLHLYLFNISFEYERSAPMWTPVRTRGCRVCCLNKK